MRVHVILKSAYGTERIYPACDKAQLICKLLGTSTIPAPAIAILKAIGFEIVNVTPLRSV